MVLCQITRDQYPEEAEFSKQSNMETLISHLSSVELLKILWLVEIV